MQTTQSLFGVEGLHGKLEICRNHYSSQSTSRHCTFSVQMTQSAFGVEDLEKAEEIKNLYFVMGGL